MRLIHTSDWHLGRTLHGVDLRDAQARALDQLCRFVEEPADGVPVDAVLVSGDVFDRGVPAVESMELLDTVLARLIRHCHVVLISGNHDSPRRLGFGSGLFRDRLHLVTEAEAVDRPVTIVGADQVVAQVYAIPFLEPEDARVRLAGPEEEVARSHEAVVGAAMRRIRADLADRTAAGRGADAGAGVRSVVMAHAFVTGAAPCESERSIAVGGVECVSAQLFAGIDYVALGHLHRPQQVTKTPPGTLAHYSGSLLRYSFDEAGHDKVVLQVDLPARGDAVVTALPLTPPREMAVLRGTLDALTTDPAHARHTGSWVRAEVTDPVRPERMMARLRERFEHLLAVAHLPQGQAPTGAPELTRRDRADVAEVGADFIAYVTAREALAPERELFRQAERRARARAAARGA